MNTLCKQMPRLGLITLMLTMLMTGLAISQSEAMAHDVTKQTCLDIAREKEKNQYATYKKCMKYGARHLQAHVCRGKVVARPTLVKGHRATRAQRRNIAQVITIGYDMDMTLNEIISSIMAITQESSANNLPYGHGTSVGILQLINIHGDVGWRMKIRNSAGWYFRGVQQLNTRRMSPGQIADAVQRPAVRGLYDAWHGEATRTVDKYLGPMKVCLVKR